MKFLRIGTAHCKNIRGFELLAQEAQASLDVIDGFSQLLTDHYDLVFIPQGFYHSLQLPNAKRILYGPQNFVFPNEPWVYKFEPSMERSLYTCLSPYLKKIWDQFPPLCLPVKALPFPVDIEKFSPNNSEKTYDCFIYFKSRSESNLQTIEDLCKKLNYKYVVFRYGHYKEEEYIYVVNKCRFGIWCGAHESQGFALQEALCMNIPLIVCNIRTLNDEINGQGNHSYPEYKDNYDLSATSCPYFDDRCGIIIYHLNELNDAIVKIDSQTFNPREYILETLSPKVCYERIIESFNEL